MKSTRLLCQQQRSSRPELHQWSLCAPFLACLGHCFTMLAIALLFGHQQCSGDACESKKVDPHGWHNMNICLGACLQVENLFHGTAQAEPQWALLVQRRLFHVARMLTHSGMLPSCWQQQHNAPAVEVSSEGTLHPPAHMPSFLEGYACSARYVVIADYCCLFVGEDARSTRRLRH
jgi:hypothetical protein